MGFVKREPSYSRAVSIHCTVYRSCVSVWSEKRTVCAWPFFVWTEKASSRPMDVEDVDKQAKTNLYIVEYLKRKGYIEAARQLEPFVPQVQSANQLAENISKLTDQRIVNVIRTGTKGMSGHASFC